MGSKIKKVAGKIRANEAPKLWRELCMLTADDNWEYDSYRYFRVRKIAYLFGGALLPDTLPIKPEVERNAGKWSGKKAKKEVVVVDPLGVKTEYPSMTEAADGLGYEVGNLSRVIRSGKTSSRGRLAGYYIYIKNTQ